MNTTVKNGTKQRGILSELMRNVSWWLWLVFHPSYWIQNHDEDKRWDREFNEHLESGRFKIINRYTAEINGVTVWIANQPYATFRRYDHLGPHDHRPSRWTIRRGLKLLNQSS